MAFRTVQGTILKFNDEPHKKLPVFFKFTGGFTSAYQFPGSSEIVYTDDNGFFTTELWTNIESNEPSKYTCRILNESFGFDIETGSTVLDISTLRIPVVPGIPVEPIVTAYESLAFSGSNNLQLVQVVADLRMILVFVNGYRAIPSTDFIVDGSTLIWTGDFPLESSDIIEVYY